MKHALIRFVSSSAVFAALCVAIGYTNREGWLTAWFLLLLFGALPVLILTWVELGRALRSTSSSSRTMFILGVIFGLPQALFGLLALVSGVSIMGWVLYNSFVERQPQYTGGFLSFGVGPVLVLFGVLWLRDAFTQHNGTVEAQQDTPAVASRRHDGV